MNLRVLPQSKFLAAPVPTGRCSHSGPSLQTCEIGFSVQQSLAFGIAAAERIAKTFLGASWTGHELHGDLSNAQSILKQRSLVWLFEHRRLELFGLFFVCVHFDSFINGTIGN